MFWLSSGISMVHSNDELIYEVIDEGRLLKVSRNSIRSINGKTLTLADGTTQVADVLIFATGWTHPLCTSTPLFTHELAEELELPVDLSKESDSHKKHWSGMEQETIRKIYELYPILENPPAHLNLANRPAKTFSKLHHFRNLVPPRAAANNDHSVVFLSNVHTGYTPTHAEVSALWSYAYLEDEMPPSTDAPLREFLKDEKAMEKEAVWHHQYNRTRYVDLVENLAIGAFEGRDFIDRLLMDLGIRHDRHAMLVGKDEWFAGWKAWWREYFGNYMTQEYAGIIDEYRELLAKR